MVQVQFMVNYHLNSNINLLVLTKKKKKKNHLGGTVMITVMMNQNMFKNNQELNYLAYSLILQFSNNLHHNSSYNNNLKLSNKNK